MTTVPEEAVNAAHEAYDRVAAINPRLSYSTRVAVKAALTAALPFLSVLEPSAARQLALGALKTAYASMEGSCSANHRIALNTVDAAIRALSSPDHADAGKVEGDGWLPIESAPKDGTVFLAVHPHGQVDFFHWQSRGPHIGWRDSFITVYPDEAGPKIWMPIPPLPSAPASEGAE